MLVTHIEMVQFIRISQVFDITLPTTDDGTLAKKEIISYLRPSWNPDKIITKVSKIEGINSQSYIHVRYYNISFFNV